MAGAVVTVDEWTRQPNYSCRAKPGIKVLFNPACWSNVVTGRIATQRHSTYIARRGCGPSGVEATYSSATSYASGLWIEAGDGSLTTLVPGKFAAWLGRITASDATYFTIMGGIVSSSVNDGNYGGSFEFLINGSNAIQLRIHTTGGYETLTSGLTVQLHKQHLITVRATANEFILSLDDKLETLTPTNAILGTGGTVVKDFRIGATSSYNAHRYWCCSMAAFGDTAAAPPAFFHGANPWALFAP